jgi:hypothetical protein
VISQKGLDELAEDYRRALGAVNSAAHTLEEASLFAVEVTGQFGATASSTLISSLNEIYVDINNALSRIRNAHPTD